MRGVPTLPAYRERNGVSIRVWCKHCQEWHGHGRCNGTCNPDQRTRLGFLRPGVACQCPAGVGNGHRVAHCGCACTPYYGIGYTLEDTGEWFEDQPKPARINIEKAARMLSKAERRIYLREQGWYRLGAYGSEVWFAPGWMKDPHGVVDPPDADPGFYSLAAAIRKQLSNEAGVHYGRW